MIQEIMQFTNRHLILSLIWIVLLLAVSVLTFKVMISKTKNITCAQAIHLINKEEASIVDLRFYDDFHKGHIINSISLTPLEIKKNNFEKLVKKNKKPIILVSENGIVAFKLIKKLVQCGFDRVFVLKKGITGWSSEKLPLDIEKK